MKPPFRSWETETRPCLLLWKAGHLGMEEKTPARGDADRPTLVFHTRCCPRSAPLPSAPRPLLPAHRVADLACTSKFCALSSSCLRWPPSSPLRSRDAPTRQ